MLLVKVLVPIILLISPTVQIKFRGSCPEPPKSIEFLPEKLPSILSILAPLTIATVGDAPIFSKREFGGEKCLVELTEISSNSNQTRNFLFGGYRDNSNKSSCYILNCTLRRTTDDEYVPYNLQYNLITNSLQEPDCIRNWTYTNKLSIYIDDGIMILWTCFDNRPSYGSYDAGMIGLTYPNVEEKDYLIPFINLLTFTQLSVRKLVKRSDKNCTATPKCSLITDCPSLPESWRSNLGIIIWLLCFSIISLVSCCSCRIVSRWRKINQVIPINSRAFLTN